jgi:hypothetical protein
MTPTFAIFALAFALQDPAPVAPPTTPPPAGAPPPAAAAPPAADEWKPLAEPKLIVNEELVTSQEVLAAVVRRARAQKKPIQSQEDFLQREGQEVTFRASEMLRKQAGKDLGFDADLVNRFVRDQMEKQKEDAGSLGALAEELAREEVNSLTRYDETQSYVYAILWNQSTTGISVGPGGRVAVDRYVRPGRILFEYRDLATQAREVDLTRLIVSVARAGGEKEAREMIEDLRNRVVAGEDMGELADRSGETKPGTHGASGFVPVARLNQIHPEMQAFLGRAKIGDLSGVMTLRDPKTGEVLGFMVVRPEQWKTMAPPRFDDGELQTRITEDVRRALDGLRIQRGLMRLLEAAFVWPPNAFSPEEPQRDAP